MVSGAIRKILLDESTPDGNLALKGRSGNERLSDSNLNMHSLFFERFSLARMAVLWLSVGMFACRGTAAESMDFPEVYQLLKANLAGVSEQELNAAAVKGLLDQLGSKASLVEDGVLIASTNGSRTAVSAEIFDKHFAYVRINTLAVGVGAEVQSSYDQLRSTNNLKGLVIDLRYAGGQNYVAAVALADRFFAAETDLVDWGEGWKRSSAKTNAISLPTAVLVNRKTSGAAEALAGILRQRDVGLLIGTNTAGQASVVKIFPLKTGQRLRVAVAPLKVADGHELPLSGMKADIEVEVSPEDELAYYNDAFKVLAKPAKPPTLSTNESIASGTNRAPRRRLNEAELVRMNRDGQSLEREPVSANLTPGVLGTTLPVVNDPSLARALDLLKGLAVVRQFRSP